MECFCCGEKYNKTNRTKITCKQYNSKGDKCGYESCRSCIKRYILSSSTNAQCMKCNKKYSRNFMVYNLTRSWTDDVYIPHLSNLLFETEKMRSTENIQEAKNYSKIDSLSRLNREMRRKKKKLQSQISVLDDKINENERKIKQYNEFRLHDIKENIHYIMKCPNPNCRGFINKQWECILCDTLFCSKCLEPKLNDKHVCNIEKKKTVDFITKEKKTKPCPKCGELIHKIDGCDHMWCIQCHTAWHWVKGTIINGSIHNPHFNEFQKKQKEDTKEVDVCKELPTFSEWKSRVDEHFKQSYTTFQKDILIQLHLSITNFRNNLLEPLQLKINNLKDNKKIRVFYLINKFDQKKCKQILAEKYNKITKLSNILHVYELYNVVCTDNILLMYNDMNKYEEFLHVIQNLRMYVNYELSKISFLHKKSVKIITNRFEYTSITITNRNMLEKYAV